ncbi:MAG: mechanosensitive ion channel family protein, partial [Planctomycetota bacterium]
GRIVLNRGEGGNWRFNRATVEGLNGLYRELEELPERFGTGEIPLTPDMWLRERIPDGLKEAVIFDIEHWQWLGLLALLLLGGAADLFVRLVLRVVWGRVEVVRGMEADPALIKRAVWPFGLFVSALIWLSLVRYLGFPPTPQLVLLVAGRFVMALTAVLASFRLVDLFAAWLVGRAAMTSTKLDDLLVPLLRKVFKTFAAAFALIYIADNLEIQIMPLLTGLGIGGLAFAFAAKDTIENFFGSVAVILDRPFEIGDWVQIGDVEGTVESMGLRATRIRTFYDSLITVPNATLVRATVDNFGRRQFRRYTTRLAVTYDTPADSVEAFCEGIRELVRVHPFTRTDSYHVWVNDFGESAVEVLVYVFFKAPDWGTELRERHRLLLDISRLAERLGVSFAFPTRTVHFRNDDLAEPGRPADDPGRHTELAARQVGVMAAQGLTKQAPWRVRTPPAVSFGGSGEAGLKQREGIEPEGDGGGR